MLELASPLLADLPADIRILLPERFWSKVEQRGACWEWTAGRQIPFGHGRYWLNGKNRPATNVVWEALCGPLGDNWVLHHCDNPPCVFPRHLFLGDCQANTDDKVQKGRQHRPIGDMHHNRLLSEDLVRKIKARLVARDRGADIARDTGVHPNTIYSIKSGRSWGHVTC